MPKKVFESLMRAIERDIRTNFMPGDRYLTLRDTAKKFHTSYATAAKAMSRLCDLGMVDSFPKSGIIVKALEHQKNLSKMKIALVTRQPQYHQFVQAFAFGIAEMCSAHKIKTVVESVPEQDFNSIGFGDYITKIDADGIIAISFANSPLAFYHAMVSGVNLVSDTAYPELPLLPVVETDNFRHGQEAARKLNENGRTEILITSCWPIDIKGYRDFYKKRVDGFCAMAKKLGMKTSFLQLNHHDSEAGLDRFFYNFSHRKAVFTIEQSANTFMASQFIHRKIPVKNFSLLAYDNHDETYNHEGLPPIPTIAPSLKTLGRELAFKLISKFKNGSFDEPLYTLI